LVVAGRGQLQQALKEPTGLTHLLRVRQLLKIRLVLAQIHLRLTEAAAAVVIRLLCLLALTGVLEEVAPVLRLAVLVIRHQLLHLKAITVEVQAQGLAPVMEVGVVALLHQDNLEQHLQLKVATAAMVLHLLYLAHRLLMRVVVVAGRKAKLVQPPQEQVALEAVLTEQQQELLQLLRLQT
jgi:hypothetical protein